MTAKLQVKPRPANAELLSRIVAEGMLEKKGIDIVILDLRKVKNAVTDFFVICSGNSDTQVEALMDSVEEQVYKHLGEWPWQKEGKANREWILLDYVNVVAHIFKKERRLFYGLEELWGDAEITRIESSMFSTSVSS
ncbi:MAG: ribosome silencing factor [Cytophagales bacterium]|nr:ribosome silencing factor [Bernardetiaceae bacterium]MDW8204991.1 ribosome silencing factor [Cytophagales bacterium]